MDIISARKRALYQLCFLSLRVEVKEEKDTKVVLCKWYSEVKYKVENFNYLNVAFISYKLTMWD